MKDKYKSQDSNDNGTDIDRNYTNLNSLYKFEGKEWNYHFDLHQKAIREKLTFTNDMTMDYGEKYRGYLKSMDIDDPDSCEVESEPD